MNQATSNSPTPFSTRLIRNILGTLLAFAAINAFGGGYYGMSGAEGVSLELLQGSPFDSYFIPGLVLFVIVGGSFLIACVAVFARLRFARFACISTVVVVYGWLAVQIAIIGYISWMQPVTAIVVFVIFLLTLLLYRTPQVTTQS
jgi:hypothetical protein